MLMLAGFGGKLGDRARDELSATALLGGLLGLAAGYAAALAGGAGSGAARWGIALGAAALGAWGASLFRLDRLIRRWRLPRVDIVFTMLVDVQLSFPTFFLILTVIALLPPSIWNIMVVIGLTGWVGPARFVRAEILSLRERPFMEAATALGGNDARLIFLHLVPNSLAPVLVSATIGIAGAILVEASLSFLGFGVPPPHATWGNILSDGKKYLFDAPWLTYIPGLAILLVVLAFNLFGEGLRDALNPRAKPS
ncbi:MAG: ABC transporter permease [Candidatus Tectomicrobia bacterium]|uniref:ABC transporter permease n=1 Tax=Tectimicrobiota bacterium TaxID=2528274 RepID=A0A932HZN6_UNCTE|nr:ABC transporter permease [Candidatus Tectomicrobia bacterium]